MSGCRDQSSAGAAGWAGHVGAAAFLCALRASAKGAENPDFRDGWRMDDDRVEPYLSYVGDDGRANWSADLEDLHERAGRDHFLDAWTREVTLAALRGDRGARPTVIADLGCSSGLLLADLRARWPVSLLVGVDLIPSGLRRAHAAVPSAALFRASVTDLPFADESVDAVLALNVLEHVGEDVAALREVARVLRPGGRAVLVVPTGPGLYDYYDAYLRHERRYARGELAAKVCAAGLRVRARAHVGCLLYPPFWARKKLNRWRAPEGGALAERVRRDIERTRSSIVGRLACRLERRLLAAGWPMPVGIREVLVAEAL